MRILLSSNHRYPGSPKNSRGLEPNSWPSGSGFLIHDLIAKGLAELGHEVFYRLPEGAAEPLPPGVQLVSDFVEGAQIVHTMSGRDHDLLKTTKERGIASVVTCHLDPTVPGRLVADPIHDNWIFVSRTLAHSLGRDRYVLNGIDPREYRFSAVKQDYFLFIASMDWADHKGLGVALDLARKMGFRLIVAGTAKARSTITEVARRCSAAGAEYIGDVRGAEKATLFADARALLFPTQVNEAFGLAIAEALMSGTPVICSSHGACGELVTPEVGFVCHTEGDYCEAVERIERIAPDRCREAAMTKFHYLRMAGDYLREYERERAGAAVRPHLSARCETARNKSEVGQIASLGSSGC
jgi:glycosyltransferase involved in cell wall biosynthesis